MRHWKMIAMFVAFALLVAGCGGNAGKKTADMAAIYEQVAESLPEMYQMDADTMLDYLGISMDDCIQAVAAVASEGVRADEIWLIEAKDARALTKIQELAQSRLAAKEEETVQYAPTQYSIVKDAKRLTQGQYFALVVSPDADTILAAVKSAWE